MGQSVRTMAKVGDASAIKVDKNGHKKEQDADVTQFIVGQNSDNSSTAVLLLSDEPSMSSIVDTQANDNPAHSNSNTFGSGNASARLFSKRPWIGCQSLTLSDSRSRFTATSTSTVAETLLKGGEGVRGGVIVGAGGGGGTKNVSSNSRLRSTSSKTRLRKPSSSILNDISFGSLLVDKKKSSFNDIQEQQGIQKFISLVANSSSHAKTQSDDNISTLRATATSSPEMEQLITMMKNHKVSEEDEDRISNMDNNKNTQQMMTTATTTTATTITATSINNNNNANHIKDTPENDLCKGLQIDQSDPKYAYLKNRKILPLPKPRLRKSTSDNGVQIASSPSSPSGNMFKKEDYNMMDQNDRENSKKMRHSISPSTSSANNQPSQYHNILSNTSSFDFSMDKLKQLPLQNHHPKTLDPITIKLDLDKSKPAANVSGKSNLKKSTPSSSPSSNVASSDTKPATNTKQTKRSSSSKKKKKGKMAVQSPPSSVSVADESSMSSTLQQEQAPNVSTRKGNNSNNNNSSSTSTSSNNNKRRPRNQQKKRWDDDFSTAPGGFLSSDITLFDNPLSDDWICLFCQYDVLCHGLEVTKRKNGYYRRKRERLQREASRRLMHHEPSDSEDELIFKDERHIRTS